MWPEPIQLKEKHYSNLEELRKDSHFRKSDRHLCLEYDEEECLVFFIPIKVQYAQIQYCQACVSTTTYL